jgi:hypothetical protein
VDELEFVKKIDDQVKTMGLPHLDDPQYVKKIEQILQELVDDDKLLFAPPDKYAFQKKV